MKKSFENQKAPLISYADVNACYLIVPDTREFYDKYVDPQQWTYENLKEARMLFLNCVKDEFASSLVEKFAEKINNASIEDWVFPETEHFFNSDGSESVIVMGLLNVDVDEFSFQVEAYFHESTLNSWPDVTVYGEPPEADEEMALYILGKIILGINRIIPCEGGLEFVTPSTLKKQFAKLEKGEN